MKNYIVVFLFLISKCSSCAINLYLDLMKKALVNTIYEDVNMLTGTYDDGLRENGRDWPQKAFTMIGLKGLNNLQFCTEDILKNNIPGDFLEAGVWRGGSCIFMRAILKAYDIVDRSVYVVDSFQGLPKPNIEQYPEDHDSVLYSLSELAIPLDVVQRNFEKFNLLDNQVKFIKGWFKDTLPTLPVEKISLLRLDGDMYESTINILDNLYHKLSIGGYIIIDDFYFDSCSKAVYDFRNKHNITEKIEYVDWTRVYWKRLQ